MRTQSSLAARLLVILTVALLGAACATGARPAAPSAPAAAPPAAPADAPPAAAPAVDPIAEAMTLPLDELYQRALAEGGQLSYYGTLAQINAEKILPAYEARFPGIKVDHIDATSERLAARIIAEARGGKVLADVFEANLSAAAQLHRQGLLLPVLPPEADAYPPDYKGSYYLAIGMTALVVAWNTNLVRPEEAPRAIEDLADPRWRGRIIAEPQDTEFLVGLVRKFGSEERALEVLRRIAANQVEFHRGHSELAELLVAGQAAVCLTCYSHHFPSRMRRGAPVDFLLDEGVVQLTTTAIVKGAPHPYNAVLWQRFMHTEEGQQIYAEGGRTPVHPNVRPIERIRPEKAYAVTEEDMAQLSRYERLWKEVFQLR